MSSKRANVILKDNLYYLIYEDIEFNTNIYSYEGSCYYGSSHRLISSDIQEVENSVTYKLRFDFESHLTDMHGHSRGGSLDNFSTIKDITYIFDKQTKKFELISNTFHHDPYKYLF